jgi:cell division protein FtsQ
MSTTRTSTVDRRPSVVGAPERFAVRPRAERRRRWLRRGVLLALVALFAGAAWVLGWSDLLGVRTIQVVGVQRVPANLVVLTSDVEVGTPLARVDTAAVARKVEGLRVVADVTVERVWPHTLRITVHEREAVTVARRGDTLRLLDGTGVDFANAQAVPRALPLLDLDLDRATPDEVAAGLAVVQGIPRSLERRVATVQVRSPDDVRLRLRNGAVVYWGDSSALARKAEVLTALLPQGAQRYDVRAPDAPTTTG